jgi:hypothetical protein
MRGALLLVVASVAGSPTSPVKAGALRLAGRVDALAEVAAS